MPDEQFVSSLEDPTGTCRAELRRREDGRYHYVVSRRVLGNEATPWTPTASSGLYDQQEAAVRDATSEIDHLGSQPFYPWEL